jgi:penicillin G amidase
VGRPRALPTPASSALSRPWLLIIALAWLLTCSLASIACQRSAPPASPPLVAQVSGTIALSGLVAPARIVRDQWGVPHIYAERQGDLFFAQGFVQAQDRLFQMDLWRRSVQGRLSEVLGSNFIVRDAMTRRIQYRGDPDVEWASYGPDARAVAAAFVTGVNAWVAIAREHLPEEFVLAGWKPELWVPEDLLNRTEAFLASGNALEDIRRLKLNAVVAEAIGRVGTPPFFSGLAAGVKVDAADNRVGPKANDSEGSSPPLLTMQRPRSAGSVSATRGGRLSFTEARRTYDLPSARYLVHLHAPGWNVIGATAPWRPGVALGHNEEFAWGMTASEADTQDVYVVKVNPSDQRQVEHGGAWADTVVIRESIAVKGRAQPFEFEYQLTPRGVVIAADSERHLVYAVRWSGAEPGAAAELAALTLDRARTLEEFRSALKRWKMPPSRVVYAGAGGASGFQDAALVPLRRAGEWIGWKTIDDLPHAFDPRGPIVARSGPRETPAIDRSAVFAHVLAISGPARHRFNIGPLVRPDDDAPVHATLAPADWDRSTAMNAPGQSGSPGSAHFSDLAALWEKGEAFPLAFSDAAVQASARNTLVLTPKQP